ncbi:RNA-binding protein EWS [Pseudocyphellaria aurata]|nr:RNA-binding protein EWS [Pseudocyphellaria aurata]
MQPAKSSLPGSNGHHQHYGPAGSYPGVAQANGSTAGQPTGTLSQIPSYAAAYQQPYQYAQAQPYGSLYAAQAYAEQPGFKQLAAQGAAPARYDAAAYAYALQHFAPPAPAAQQQQQAWPQQASYPQHAAYSHTTAYAQHAAYPQQSAYPAHLAGAYPAPSGSNTYQQPARSSNMQRLLNAANTYRDQHQPASPSHQQPARSHQQQPAAAQHALPRPAASQQVPAADQPPGRAVSCPTSTATQHAAPAALTHAPSEVTQPARQAQPAHASPAPHASQHALPTAQPQHGSDRLRERQYDDGTRFSDEEEDRKEHPSSGWDSDSDGHPGRSRLHPGYCMVVPASASLFVLDLQKADQATLSNNISSAKCVLARAQSLPSSRRTARSMLHQLQLAQACFLAAVMQIHAGAAFPYVICLSMCACRKRGVRSARGRPPKRVKQATPPVNEMREKLRSAAAADTPSPEPAAAQEPEHLAVPDRMADRTAEQPGHHGMQHADEVPAGMGLLQYAICGRLNYRYA